MVGPVDWAIERQYARAKVEYKPALLVGHCMIARDR